MATDVDLVILGGGCAGLSLALRLAERPGLCQRVTVVEARPTYQHDRSWCFWRTGPHRYEHLLKCSWSNVALRSATRAVEIDCASMPYQLLEASAFYSYAQQTISTNADVQLRLGTTVLGPPTPFAGGWHVDTSAGTLTAARVIDTRPPHPTHPPQREDALMWQSFVGEELLCDRAVFDPDRVMLMDFACDLPGAVAFTYVLPLADNRALIETTLFDVQPHAPADLARRQQAAVLRLCGAASAQVLRTEAGILPMGITRPHTALGRGYYRAGLMSGAARPATGFAFQRIQRWADACSAALRNGYEPFGHRPDPLLTRLMDGLFLNVLRSHPERGPELFTSLFRHVSTPRMVRFLSDEARFFDRVAVAASLPTGLFLRQLLRQVPRGALRAQTT